MKLKIEWDRFIFDAHLHIGTFGTQENKAGSNFEIFQDRELHNSEDIHNFMKLHHIEKAICVPHYTAKPEESFTKFNPLVLHAVETIPNLFGGLWVNPAQPSLTSQALSDFYNNDKLKVIKMNPLTWGNTITPDPKTWPEKFAQSMKEILSFAKENNLIIQTHTGLGNSSINKYDPFVDFLGEKLDGLKIHFLHMGGSNAGHLMFVPRFINWLNQGYDFYTDTSHTIGYAPWYLIKECKEICPKGLNRIMFASDEPWGIFQAGLEALKALPLDKTLFQKILYFNAERLYCKK
ncbi:amidohydrolase family protein [Candidatus Woesearchaeota archaeon]|nr:amidohydrolase family protein [Candidatus Woesearchaeota archaeon]